MTYLKFQMAYLPYSIIVRKDLISYVYQSDETTSAIKLTILDKEINVSTPYDEIEKILME